MTTPNRMNTSAMPIARAGAAAPATTKQKDQDSSVTVYTPYGGKDEIKLSISIVKRYIAAPTRSGRVCSDDDAVKFILMCKARALNPFEGDAFLVGYDSDGVAKFSLITAHQAFLKRAELHPEYDGMKSGVVIAPGFQCAACDGERIVRTQTTVAVCPICNGAGLIDELEGDIVPHEQDLVGGWCTVFCKNRKVHIHKRIPIGPYRKPFGVWKDNPSGMIVKCAEADGLRSTFPTMLGGLYLREEIELFPDGQAPASSASPPSFLGPVTDVQATTSQPASTGTGTERPTKAQDDDQVPGAEVPPVKASESAPVGSTPQTTPERLVDSPPEAPTGSLEKFFSRTQEEVAGLSGKDLVQAVRDHLQSHGCTEGQLTTWARGAMQAKSDQQWSDMSEGKLRNVLTKFNVIGPNIKAAKG
jgi:phage recombination protein Bet